MESQEEIGIYQGALRVLAKGQTIKEATAFVSCELNTPYMLCQKDNLF